MVPQPVEGVLMRPKVSVLTCSFNRPGLLRQAVQSMRDQTDGDWEHLIYDDASTNPKVLDILKWAAEDPRVRVWRDDVNHDQPSALWNFLADRSYGRYLTVLDDDNTKLPRFVETMSRELDADPTVGIVTCGWRVDRDDEPPHDYFLNMSTSVEELARTSTCDGGAMLYRREVFEAVGYFSEAFRTSEDWDWLRRAAHQFKIKNLREVHATYRSHNQSRMNRSTDLGVHADMAYVRAKPPMPQIGTTLVYPPRDRLTQSQRDVVDSLSRGLNAIAWAPPGRDLCIIAAPFQMGHDEIDAAIKDFPRVLSLHMEDPYAGSTNLHHVRRIAASGVETWVCTNDASMLDAYQQVVGGRVVVCPTLGPDDQTTFINALDALNQPVLDFVRDVDILLCGYAYPSRKRFVADWLPRMRGYRVKLVGNGWEDFKNAAEVLPTQSLADTYRLHTSARAVVCLHRTHGDAGDGPVAPVNVNRGAMEGYCGARVFLDRSRPLHSFDTQDVSWFDGPEDLAIKLQNYLAVNDTAARDAFAEKCRLNYTYRTRLARILNCVRTPRFSAEIP